MVNWVHVTFQKPLIVNGFALKSGPDNENRDMKNFRIYAKVLHNESEIEFTKDESLP